MAIEQRLIHIVTELVAVFILSPVMIYIANNSILSDWKKNFILFFAYATILLDGYLLLTWL